MRSGPKSVDALIEAIGIIRRVWAAERGISVDGEHYRMHGAHAGRRPRTTSGLARRLRAADDARGRAPRRRVDPVAAAAAAGPVLPKQDAIDEAARKAGRDPAAIRRVANLTA